MMTKEVYDHHIDLADERIKFFQENDWINNKASLVFLAEKTKSISKKNRRKLYE